MSVPPPNGSRWRASPFNRGSASPSPTPVSTSSRPQSMDLSIPKSQVHARAQSINSLIPTRDGSVRVRSNSHRNSMLAGGTFAPKFIKSEEMQNAPQLVRGIDGENDFSGKRYVWLRHPEKAFVRGWVVEELEGNNLLVQCDDGDQQTVDADTVDKVNPAKFDKADDMAMLTHLNEASVVHNLHQRYQADLIYTYSGLFLVTVNPYCPLPIYTRDYINMYKGRSREDTKPHIYAIADEAFRNLVDEGENQSILVTGESGAGKTENTKKVIQYLAAVATGDSNTPGRRKASGRQMSNLSEQILRANPILEAFGNAQTVRNNNSSRFGKFIRIEFTRTGQIAGAYIDWYLLEKSRVVRVNSSERNYHVFYQLLQGAPAQMKQDFLLDGKDLEDFEYTKHGNDTISGVSDSDEWNSLVEAFIIMGFSEKEQHEILRTIGAVLHLGNITVIKESIRADQAAFDPDAEAQAEKVARLLGIPVEPFIRALLHPRVKAGREWVEKVQTPEQVRLAVDALSKGIYERGFGDLVDRINRQLDRSNAGSDDSHFIGVLDIAGFEIFEENSFEQLCINYTNEKLQQFFNHHMFVLEQEEYAREQIEWKFIDFGRDLQPTIDLIEVSNPIGIFSCLDEDSVMPKATDRTFTEKLHQLWDRKTPKYRRSMLRQGFMLTHYAAEVEYSTEGWLEKNKDPLNDNVTRLLASSTEKHIAKLFADCADTEEEAGATRNRVKRGLFRTVAQRHKENLSKLMGQLHSTHPHFVRCILPNHKKRPKQFSAPLVLDQLRCNGVLEGIRIARTGFPNRLPFAEFRQRYEILCRDIPRGYLEGQVAARMILENLDLDKSFYRVGLTKVFFRAGVLAELEEQRDVVISKIMARFQSVARGYMQRRIAHKRLYRAEATRVIQRNFQVYLDLQANPWWQLFVRMRPLLGATRQAQEVKKRDEMIQKLEEQRQAELAERERVEDERRRAEGEIQRIQETLESERALAIDKEEIFKRLQVREAELVEKLSEAEADSENLEEQLSELMIAKKKTEEQADEWRKELEQAGDIISGLETEKQELVNQITELELQVSELENSRTQRTAAEEKLQQELNMLNSHLSLKDKKLRDLEEKMLKNDQELDIKLANATKDLTSAKKQVKDLIDENREVRKQMTDLSNSATSYEDLVRRKDSELAILKSENRQYESDRQKFDTEKKSLTTRHENVQAQLREVKAEMEAIQSAKAQLEREAADAKKLLDAKLSEDAEFVEDRRILEQQLQDLKAELFQIQTELSRERQSRDDVEMLGEHKYNELKQDYDTLKEAKVTIEKEMYVQQDVLRRANEGKAAAEKEQKNYQDELRQIRQQYLQLQEQKLEADASAEQNLVKMATERQTALRQQLEAKDAQMEELEAERARLNTEVQGLTQMIAESDTYRAYNDQHKERLERELVTFKGRLAASENDNRALLNKIQQKNLDIARSNSRAGDSQRTRISQLTNEKTKLEDENKKLQRQVEDSQLMLTSLEKQKEKLSLGLEDLNHEVTREQMASRNAEKSASTANLQLADANRKLETERQLRTQAQANNRTLQSTLENAENELAECRNQLVLLRKVFEPDANEDEEATYESAKAGIDKAVDLAKKLDAAQIALRQANERAINAEILVEELRERYDGEINDLDARHSNSKRALLEELSQNQLNQAHTRHTPSAWRRDSEIKRPFTPPNGTFAQRQLSNATHDSARSEKSVDTVTFNNKMDMAAELEMVQNQLQMSEMRSRHLQNQLDRSPTKSWDEESPSMRRMQKLERENFRLHDMLDDSAKKVSSLEHDLRNGQLSLTEVQTKSYEELYDLLNSQEHARKSILQSHNSLVNELASAKIAFDELKQTRREMEVELRDSRSELADVNYEREQEAANHSQLLQEFSDLQIRLDNEQSKLLDVTSSLNLYKSRADEYFSKLEQAEIAVLKASRAEQFAKTQSREAEDQCASIMAERQQMDNMVEDLQRQTQQYEERIEDLSADLEAALQAKKRLQNELEDYRSQRAIDIEDTEASMESTRKKYQAEMSTLSEELEQERHNIIRVREENGRLHEEIENWRAKWDDEILNSSTWAKEKGRLEMTLQDLSNSRDEAVSAHNEAQGKIVNLLSQVRSLRTSVDDASAERDSLLKEKKGLESRLAEAADRLDELARSESPSLRNAAEVDRELLELKSGLAQQEDIASAAVGKMRRAEALGQELQKDLVAEREANVKLHTEKASIEKKVKDLQLRLIDLETKSFSSASQDVKYLHGRIQELEKSLEEAHTTRNTESRANRNIDRTVKDLQQQIERRERANASISEDLAKSREKISTLLSAIDELQSSDSTHQLAAKRAERELREERETRLRVERELEGWKGLRIERRSALGVPGNGQYGGGSDYGGGVGGGAGSRRDSYAELLSELQPPRALGGPTGSMRSSMRRASNGTRNSFL
ncbi:Myosin type-2 heavy chain 1 [Diplodia seriata]|uniref:Myosin type-2 heavy chain 1 n=2 Tax=Diplodia seriata TaxID=420778 RepID=A0A1S8B931_9PEZI|nr:Myosin type-2 heavy chain 1 [Diplodia seriata]